MKQRNLEVDASRVVTWWHLIEKLQMSRAGSAKLRLFHTVSAFSDLGYSIDMDCFVLYVY